MSDQIRCQTCGEWDDPAEGCGCPERIRALLVSALADLAAAEARAEKAERERAEMLDALNGTGVQVARLTRELGDALGERDDYSYALDVIRADCKAAGFPGEEDKADPDSSDPAPIRVWHSTPSLVALAIRGLTREIDEALGDLAAERKAHAAAVVIEGEWRKMAIHYQSEMEDIRAALSNGADDTLWPPGMTLAQAVELATLRAGEPKPRRTCGYSLCGHPDCADCWPDAVPGTVRYTDSAGERKP